MSLGVKMGNFINIKILNEYTAGKGMVSRELYDCRDHETVFTGTGSESG